MGDVLLATPLVRQTRRAYPDARLDVIVDERFAEVFRHNPHVDSVREYSRARRAVANHSSIQYDGLGYDTIIDLQHNRRSAQIRKAFHARAANERTLDKQRTHKLALVYLKRGFERPIVPIAERYRQTAQIQGVTDIPDDSDGLELWLPEEREAWKQGNIYPPSTRSNLPLRTQPHPSNARITIAIAPGAHHATKRWPAERFAAAARQIAQRMAAHGMATECVLVGGVADKELCETIVEIVKQQQCADCSMSNYAGATSLYNTARVLDGAAVLLTNDTGAMHIAAARRVPVVAVFGSTVQNFGFAPFRVPHQVVEASRDDVSCRPCTHIGRDWCFKGDFACMMSVTPERVAHAALELVGLLSDK
jgi:heptosyltransferase-2